MTANTKRIWKIVSYIVACFIVIIGEVLICKLVSGNPSRISSIWVVGNAWVRLFGCLMGVLLLQFLAVLILETYGVSRKKIRTGLSASVITTGVVILIVLAIIYSGAARLDSEFTLDNVAEYDISEAYYQRSDAVMSDDSNAKISSIEYSMNGEYIYVKMKILNDSDTGIVFDSIKYSVLSPDGKIYSGVAILDEKTVTALSEPGEQSGSFYICIPMTNGYYDIELLFDYYDDKGELHQAVAVQKSIPYKK